MLALKIAAFLLSLSLGIIASGLGRNEVRHERAEESASVDHSKHPTMYVKRLSGAGGNPRSGAKGSEPSEIVGCQGRKGPIVEDEKKAGENSPLKIVYKEIAKYTAEARSNGVQGTVTLRVTFCASVRIGSITTIKGLPLGLTENAIEAAKKMRFEPEKIDGRRRTTTRPVSFNFNIY
jgi:TonB family protein